MTYLNVIGSGESRLAWREHLTNVAISEYTNELEQDDHSEDFQEGFRTGMGMLIGNATFLPSEHTSDVESAALDQIISADEQREREETLHRQWVDAVARSKTYKGFAEWKEDRD